LVCALHGTALGGGARGTHSPDNYERLFRKRQTTHLSLTEPFGLRPARNSSWGRGAGNSLARQLRAFNLQATSHSSFSGRAPVGPRHQDAARPNIERAPPACSTATLKSRPTCLPGLMSVIFFLQHTGMPVSNRVLTCSPVARGSRQPTSPPEPSRKSLLPRTARAISVQSAGEDFMLACSTKL